MISSIILYSNIFNSNTKLEKTEKNERMNLYIMRLKPYNVVLAQSYIELFFDTDFLSLS